MIKSSRHLQRGASLIEVLISILILSFGLLAMGGMMATAVQLPKMAALRATAASIAANHIDRMRANPAGFASGLYDENLSYDGTFSVPASADCNYPNCTAASLAAMDKAAVNRALRQQLPAGGIRVERDTSGGTPSATAGNLWIVWQEPGSLAAFNNLANSDPCPTQVTSAYTNPAPRCLYLRFRL
jgi:type IV pilus assembly protein PilV